MPIVAESEEVYDAARGNVAANTRLDVAAREFLTPLIGPLPILGSLTQISCQTVTKLSKKSMKEMRRKRRTPTNLE